MHFVMFYTCFSFHFAGGGTSSHDWWDFGERIDYSSFCCSPKRGRGALSGDVTEEVRQPVQDVQPILPSVPLAAQDPEASQPPATQDPQRSESVV